MKAKRNSNIEFLRIMAMLAIVTGHLINQGGGIENISTQIFSIYVGSAARIAVNVFLFIGVYFMVDSEFKATRVLNLWGELFLYTLCFTGLALLLDHSIPAKELIKGVLPFSTRALWFASAYLILVALHPFLKYVFFLEKKKIVFLICLLTFVLCVMPTFAAKQSDFIVNISWFVYAYILIGGLKRHTEIFSSRKFVLQKYGILISILIYLALASCKVASLACDSKYIGVLCNLADQYLSDIKSIPNALCAMSVFCDVVSKKLNECKIVNKVARSAFAVYIIHQIPAFFPVLWSKIIHTDFWFSANVPEFALFLIVSVLSIYVICSVVDIFRKKWIEPRYQNSKLYCIVANNYDRVISDIKIRRIN